MLDAYAQLCQHFLAWFAIHFPAADLHTFGQIGLIHVHIEQSIGRGADQEQGEQDDDRNMNFFITERSFWLLLFRNS